MAITPINFAQLSSQPNAPTQAPTPLPQTGFAGFVSNNIINPIKSAFSSGVNQVKQGANEIGQGESPLNAVGSALKIGGGIVGAASSPLAPVINPTLGAGTNAIANKISDNQSVQKFAMSPAGQTTAKIAEAGSNAGAVAGGILGADAGVSGVSNIWDKAYNSPSSLDAATTAREGAAQTGVQSLQNMGNQVSDFKSGLGKQFSQAPVEISKIDPTAKAVLPNEIIDTLNELKDTKKFQLPNYLRTSSDEFGNNINIGDIHKGGISLTPADTQDLITRLNKLTFDAKASGDLAVNQQTIGLRNNIKDIASNAFGHVKDAQGNSVWNQAYENYAKGSTAVEKISDIVNTDKNATPTDVNSSLNSVLKLSKTPEGKIILQNAVDEFKQSSGIDLTNPTQAIGQILEKDAEFQKAVKGGIIKQAFNPQYLARLGVRIVAMSTIGYLLRNQISGAIKSLSGQ